MNFGAYPEDDTAPAMTDTGGCLRDLDAVLKARGVDRPIVVGWFYGGVLGRPGRTGTRTASPAWSPSTPSRSV